MSIFDRLDRLTSRQVDRMYGAGFELHPMAKSPNGRGGPDPAREAWIGKGVLDQTPVYANVDIGKRDRAGNDLHTSATGSRLEFSVDRNRYPEADKVKQGDQLKLDDLRHFEIVGVQPDGLSRVVLNLSRI